MGKFSVMPLPPARMGVALSNSPKGVVISGPLKFKVRHQTLFLSLVRNVLGFFSSSCQFLVSACPPCLCVLLVRELFLEVDMVSFLVLFVSTMLVIRSELGVRSSSNLTLIQ